METGDALFHVFEAARRVQQNRNSSELQKTECGGPAAACATESGALVFKHAINVEGENHPWILDRFHAERLRPPRMEQGGTLVPALIPSVVGALAHDPARSRSEILYSGIQL